MNNMKKALALVMSLAMAASSMMVVGATEYTDVPVSHTNHMAISLLGDLGVMIGDAEGTFRPEGTLTRSEACALVYRVRTGKTNADAYIGTTGFPDVVADHWATGYINYCETQGVVVGYPDGTFKPDQKVTYAEFIKMLVCALELQKVKTIENIDLTTGLVNSTDVTTTTYPNGFISIAAEQGINKDVDLTPNDAADRANVAQLVYNAMFDSAYKNDATDADFVKSNIANTNGSYENATIAEGIFKITPYQGIAVAYEDYGVGGLGDNELRVKSVTTGSGAVDETGTFDGLDSSIIGQEVKMWKQEKKNEDSKIVAVTITDNNSVMEAKTQDVKESSNDYKFAAADGTQVVKSSTTPIYVLNGKTVETSTMLDGVDLSTATLGQFLAKIKEAKAPMMITFVNNKDDMDKPEYVKIDVYAKGEITSVASKNVRVDSWNEITKFDGTTTANQAYKDALAIVKTYGGGFNTKIETIDSADKKVEKTVLYDGIAVDDKVMIYYDINGLNKLQKMNEIEGTYSGKSGSTYTVSGTGYKTIGGDTLNADISSAVKITVDPVFGLIVDSDATSASAEDYYYVETQNSDTSFGETTVTVRTYNYKSEKVDYDVKNDNGTPKVAFTGGAAAYTGDNDSGTGHILALSFTGDKVNKIKEDGDNYHKTGVTAVKYDDSWDSTKKIFTTSAGKLKVTSSSVIYAKNSDGDVKVSVGNMFSFAKSQTFSSIEVVYNSDNEIIAMYVDGSAKSVASANSNIMGYVTAASKVAGTTDTSKVVYTYTIVANGTSQTYSTPEVDEDDSQYPTGDKIFVVFDLASDGSTIIEDSIFNLSADTTLGNNTDADFYTLPASDADLKDDDGVFYIGEVVDYDSAYLTIKNFDASYPSDSGYKTGTIDVDFATSYNQYTVDGTDTAVTSGKIAKSVGDATSGTKTYVYFKVNDDQEITDIYVETQDYTGTVVGPKFGK